MRSVPIGICLVVFVYFGVPWIYALWARKRLKRKTAKSNSLVLTFDDGLPPGTRLTTAILDVLAEHKVKATFFLLGKHIPGRETIVRRINHEGHEIGAHGYAHLNYWTVSPFRALRDIKRGWQAIDTVMGTTRGTYPFRPPYGKLNLICLLYLWMRRVPIVYWTFDLGDTWSPDKRDSQRIHALIEKRGGAVLLAHDFDRGNQDVNKMVLESIQLALAQAKEKGMTVLTLSQLLGSPNQ